MVAVSLGTYFLIHYLDYLFLEIDNEKSPNLLHFGNISIWMHLIPQFDSKVAAKL